MSITTIFLEFSFCEFNVTVLSAISELRFAFHAHKYTRISVCVHMHVCVIHLQCCQINKFEFPEGIGLSQYILYIERCECTAPYYVYNSNQNTKKYVLTQYAYVCSYTHVYIICKMEKICPFECMYLFELLVFICKTFCEHAHYICSACMLQMDVNVVWYVDKYRYKYSRV